MSAENQILTPADAGELAAIVREDGVCLPRGGGTKPALSRGAESVKLLDMTRIAGVLEYEPDEYTITAHAGTRLKDLSAALAEHGQYLPFDPPLAEAGATVGGTVAAGLSGPGRQRYGGLRDFILGVRFIDGNGDSIQGGGKVVKNAAGFDFPKLMVGSLGRLGVLTEVTFKVFPEPKAYSTLKIDFASLQEAGNALVKLYTNSFDLEALELESPASLYIRIGGVADALPARICILSDFLEKQGKVSEGEEDANLWKGMKEFTWVDSSASLVKVPLSAKRLVEVSAFLDDHSVRTIYGGGASVAWVAWPADSALQDLDDFLKEAGLPGLVIRGDADYPLIGREISYAMVRRVKSALDPDNRFLPFEPTTPVSA